MSNDRISKRAAEFVTTLREAGLNANQVAPDAVKIAADIENARDRVEQVLAAGQPVEPDSREVQKLRGGRIDNPVDHLTGSGFGTTGKLADQPGFRFS